MKKEDGKLRRALDDMSLEKRGKERELSKMKEERGEMQSDYEL